jgi:uncharacterized coiled-coil protein SlyX
MTTEERLAAVEARLAEYEALIERLMMLAAQHPMGRQMLKWMVKENAK